MIFFFVWTSKRIVLSNLICRFLLCEIASFCLFFFDEGDFNDSILFVDVLQISSFEGLIFEIFHCLFLLMMFVEVEIEVEGSYKMLMYRIT